METCSYLHPDHLSTRLLTDASGNTIGQQGHYPFGGSWYAQNSASSWQFTSYPHDSESGNDYAMARSYVNRLDRFSSPDPAGLAAANLAFPQSWNRYAYANNDPTDLADPSGLCTSSGPLVVNGKVVCSSARGQGGGADGGAGDEAVGFWDSLMAGDAPSWNTTGQMGYFPDDSGSPKYNGSKSFGLAPWAAFADVVFNNSGQSFGPEGGDSLDLLSLGSDNNSGQNNGMPPDKRSCGAKLAKGVQRRTGTAISNVQYTGTVGGHANYTFDVSDPLGFQSILNQNPPLPLPFGIDHGYRYGAVQSTHINNTLTGGFSGHTDLFGGHSILAPLHLMVDVGIGHIPGVSLDFGCKANP